MLSAGLARLPRCLFSLSHFREGGSSPTLSMNRDYCMGVVLQLQFLHDRSPCDGLARAKTALINLFSVNCCIAA
jgi:hypothetical protein